MAGGLENWKDLLPQVTWTTVVPAWKMDMSHTGWPHGVACTDADLPKLLAAIERPFDWVIRTSVHALETRTASNLQNGFMRQWGTVPTGTLLSTDVWVRNLEPEVTTSTFPTTIDMATKFSSYLDARMHRAYHKLGGPMFKPAVSIADFEIGRFRGTMMSLPEDLHLELSRRRVYEWPLEARTEPILLTDDEIKGKETPDVEVAERIDVVFPENRSPGGPENPDLYAGPENYEKGSDTIPSLSEGPRMAAMENQDYPPTPSLRRSQLHVRQCIDAMYNGQWWVAHILSFHEEDSTHVNVRIQGKPGFVTVLLGMGVRLPQFQTLPWHTHRWAPSAGSSHVNTRPSRVRLTLEWPAVGLSHTFRMAADIRLPRVTIMVQNWLNDYYPTLVNHLTFFQAGRRAWTTHRLWPDGTRMIVASPTEVDIANDLCLWKREGQTWINGFTLFARARVTRYLKANEEEHDRVAREVERCNGASIRHIRFAALKDVSLQPRFYRLSARNKIHTWESGTCEELTYRPITEAVGFNTENVTAAAMAVGFRDLRMLQQLTVTGITHGTTNMPLCTHFRRNGQGSASHGPAVTDLIKFKQGAGHFTCPTGQRFPDVLPVIQVPTNGSVQRMKPDEYMKEKAGLPAKENLRAIFDGSSPHDNTAAQGQSTNEYCDERPDLNKPWVSINIILWTLSILLSANCRMYMAKWDLSKAYMQLHHQRTQTWRQALYWVWYEAGVKHGGWFRDSVCEWGQRQLGWAFHRAVTTLIVKFVLQKLMQDWVPHIRCPKLRAWQEGRAAAGLTDENGQPGLQCLGAAFFGFLDDFMLFVMSDDQRDIDLAYKIVWDCFRYLGFNINESKHATEGRPAQVGEALGHGLDFGNLTRFITAHKKSRVKDHLHPFRDADLWERFRLEEAVGLLQSLQGSVNVIWWLAPLYRLLRQTGTTGRTYDEAKEYPTTDLVRASNRARRVVRIILATLDDNRSLTAVPFRWPEPSIELVAMIPIGDASLKGGLAGVLLDDAGGLSYFSYWWPEWHRQDPHIPIAALEALTVCLMAAQWGHLLSGKRVVFRCDNENTVFGFNKLWSDSPGMALTIDLWISLLAHFRFEALLYYVKSEKNVYADLGSRMNPDDVLPYMENLALADAGTVNSVTCVPVVWHVADIDLDIIKELHGMYVGGTGTRPASKPASSKRVRRSSK